MRIVIYISLLGLLAACSPNSPVSDMTPIRQMDNGFEGRPLNAPPVGTYRAPPSGYYSAPPASGYGYGVR
jgi:hypothetical protein